LFHGGAGRSPDALKMTLPRRTEADGAADAPAEVVLQ
jgi:hypothetical protein